MTGKPSGRPGPESAAQRWLEHRLGEMVGCLHDVLDLDAGLREIRIQQQYRALDRGLREVLDVDSGLREILGASPSSADPTPSAVPADVVAASVGARAETLAGVLAARTNPAVRNLLRLLAGARAGAAALTRVNVFYLASGMVLAMGHPQMRAFALADALARADAQTDALADAVIDDGALAGALADGHALAFADALAAADAGVLSDALDRVRAFAVAVGDPRVEALARAMAGDHARTLAVADVLFGIIDRVLTRRFARLLAGIEVADLTPGQVAAVLDDFTRADLRRVSLAGVDLTGLRWSHATRWPSPGLAVEVKRRSRETSPGSGVFEVIGAEGSTVPEVVSI